MTRTREPDYVTCTVCDGAGTLLVEGWEKTSSTPRYKTCRDCGGQGVVPDPTPVKRGLLRVALDWVELLGVSFAALLFVLVIGGLSILALLDVLFSGWLGVGR